jgi:hypothetical protein
MLTTPAQQVPEICLTNEKRYGAANYVVRDFDAYHATQQAPEIHLTSLYRDGAAINEAQSFDN